MGQRELAVQAKVNVDDSVFAEVVEEILSIRAHLAQHTAGHFLRVGKPALGRRDRDLLPAKHSGVIRGEHVDRVAFGHVQSVSKVEEKCGSRIDTNLHKWTRIKTRQKSISFIR